MPAKYPYRWNVMIYLAGNNSLSEECVYGLTDILDAKIDDRVAIYAQLNTGVHRGTYLDLRKFKTREELHRTLTEVLVAQSKNGNPHTIGSHTSEIYEFVKRCMGNVGKYGAERNMLFLGGHGSGTMGAFLRDDKPGDSQRPLDTRGIGGLMKTINGELLKKKRLDILGFDSCLMSMSEIAYAVHNHVEVTIGAEGFEPSAGWPYGRIMELLNQDEIDTYSLAAKIVEKYTEYYTIYQAANV